MKNKTKCLFCKKEINNTEPRGKRHLEMLQTLKNQDEPTDFVAPHNGSYDICKIGYFLQEVYGILEV